MSSIDRDIDNLPEPTPLPPGTRQCELCSLIGPVAAFVPDPDEPWAFYCLSSQACLDRWEAERAAVLGPPVVHDDRDLPY